jgi:hypothetical protein
MAKCARYNIMWWNCQWLAAGRWFSRVLWFPQPIITDHRDITEILLRVALTNTYFSVFSSREYSLNTLVVKTHNNFNPTMHDSSLDWCFIYLRVFFSCRFETHDACCNGCCYFAYPDFWIACCSLQLMYILNMYISFNITAVTLVLQITAAFNCPFVFVWKIFVPGKREI